jgi:hypothetical protein
VRPKSRGSVSGELQTKTPNILSSPMTIHKREEIHGTNCRGIVLNLSSATNLITI